MREIVAAVFITLLWPAAAAISLGVAVGKSEVTTLGLLMLATGTMAAYGLDRWIDRRGTDSRRVHLLLLVLVLLAAMATAGMACSSLWRIKICAILAVLAGGYVPLKRLIPKNYLVVPAWTIAVGSLPFADAPTFDGRHAMALASVAFIMMANTMLCDVGSVEEDRRAKVQAMSVWLGAGMTAIVAGIFALAGVIVAASHDHFGLAITAGSLIAVAGALWTHPKSSAGHYAADLAITLLPGPLSILIG